MKLVSRKERMWKTFVFRRNFIVGVLCLPVLLLAGACGAGNTGGNDFPEGFGKLSDAEKTAYMMQKVSPDSVARFICSAALGREERVKIDTLSMAALYAYEHYKDEQLQAFSVAFDSYADALPLPEKMELRKLAANDDPIGLGYQLGLEYVNSIRMDKLSAAEVEAEIEALQKACQRQPEDSLMFKRFMTGFKVALDMDGETGIPREIYNKYK